MSKSRENSFSFENAYLDRCLSLLVNGNTTQALSELSVNLRNTRSQMERKQWYGCIQEVCLKHPIASLIHQDPFTYRSYSKPRGYAGDAQIIDYIYYGLTTDMSDMLTATKIGQQIFRGCIERPAPSAVRQRRCIVAEQIDKLAKYIEKPRILSLAAGCLREAELSHAVINKNTGEYIALDQDPESLAITRENYGKYGITTVCTGVQEMVEGSLELGEFDFIYATGLFDYLPRRFARRLAKKMLNMTRPGGHVLIPNFLPDIPDVGYMEAYMDWKLIYRTGDDLYGLFDPSEVEDHEIFNEPNNNIVFLLVHKH